MKVGPVEVIICAFRQAEIEEAVVHALNNAVASGALALMDLVQLTRDHHAVVHVRDLDDNFQAGWPTAVEYPRPLCLLSDTDLEVAAESIGNNESALVMAVEHRWVQMLSDAVSESGGVTTLYARIPHETVITALEADGFSAT